MNLRRATEADIPFLMRAERGEGYEALVGRSDEDEYREFLADPDKAIFIAHSAGENLGFILLNDVGVSDNGVRMRRVVALVPNRGVGSFLVPAVLDWIFANTSTHRVWLHTRPDNRRARHLYAKVGFTEDTAPRTETQMVYAIRREDWPRQA